MKRAERVKLSRHVTLHWQECSYWLEPMQTSDNVFTVCLWRLCHPRTKVLVNEGDKLFSTEPLCRSRWLTVCGNGSYLAQQIYLTVYGGWCNTDVEGSGNYTRPSAHRGSLKPESGPDGTVSISQLQQQLFFWWYFKIDSDFIYSLEFFGGVFWGAEKCIGVKNNCQLSNMCIASVWFNLLLFKERKS